MIVIAPPSAPQVSALQLAGVQHPLAGEALNAVRQHGSTPVSLWRVIDGLANARNPDYRARQRCWRLRYWGAVRELIRAKLLFRHGPLISNSDFATTPKPRTQDRGTTPRSSEGEPLLSPCGGELTCEIGGSNRSTARAGTSENGAQMPEMKVVARSLGTLACATETERAKPTEAEISAAGRDLARQPHGRKVWSGWLHGQRMTRLKPVIVPGGRVLPAYFVRRGYVFVLLPDEPEFECRIFERYRERDVQVYRSPQAVLLGRQKRGIKETPSPWKAASARRNGAMPARRGRRGRPRGRPPRSSAQPAPIE